MGNFEVKNPVLKSEVNRPILNTQSAFSMYSGTDGCDSPPTYVPAKLGNCSFTLPFPIDETYTGQSLHVRHSSSTSARTLSLEAPASAKITGLSASCRTLSISYKTFAVSSSS